MPTSGDDLVPGGAGDETLSGLAGNDTIYALQGNDVLYGGIGDDSLHSGSGDDTVYGHDGNDTLVNDGGNDIMYGGRGDDRFTMGDVVYGSSGTAYGGGGRDLFIVTTGAVIDGGAGIDTLLLSWGVAARLSAVTLDFDAATATSANGLGMTWTGIENLILTTGQAADNIVSGDGDDHLTVGAGWNQVDAGAGNDTVFYDITGANTLDGGDGDDVLLARNEASALYFIVDGLTGEVDDGNLSEVSNFERYEARGGAFNDIASLGTGNDTFRGGNGNDTGFGSDGRDLLYGQGQADVLSGGSGADSLIGGSGNDDLDGGGGNDMLAGGYGTDSMTGGGGADRFVFTIAESGFDTIVDFTSGEDRVLFSTGLLGVGAPPPGPLTDDMLQIEGDRATPNIFVLTYDAATDYSTLHWTDNGHGSFGLARFVGQVTMVASDIILF